MLNACFEFINSINKILTTSAYTKPDPQASTTVLINYITNMVVYFLDNLDLKL